MALLSLTKKVFGAGSAKPKGKAKAASSTKAATAGTKTKVRRTDEQAAAPLAAGNVDLALLISEKGMNAQQLNVAVFRVRPAITKRQIAAAVKTRFGVDVLQVRTVMQSPKVRRRGKTVGKTVRWKKAYVTVADMSALNVAP